MGMFSINSGLESEHRSIMVEKLWGAVKDGRLAESDHRVAKIYKDFPASIDSHQDRFCVARACKCVSRDMQTQFNPHTKIRCTLHATPTHRMKKSE